MKVAVLTSSRADYGIYYPLLKALKADNFFKLELLVFGTHLSRKFGYTVKQIEQAEFTIAERPSTTPTQDTPFAIAKSISITISKFSKIWQKKSYDLVFALGDRYEMFAAVASALPFNIMIAHIHGGETTLGAIDNAFRHGITHMSKFHFTACEEYKNRVIQLIGSSNNVYNVGALSIENLKKISFLSKEEFLAKYKIDLSKPSVLVTFHPETVSFEKNREYISVLTDVLKELKQYQVVITMPNADTMGFMVRKHLQSFINSEKNVTGIETFGLNDYLSCMKHCTFMLGNTSSGFIEASFFQNQ